MSNVNPQEYLASPHPGAILKGELEERGLSQRELASAIGKSAPMVNGILNGNKDINVEIAILLEAAIPGGLKANDWLRLQNEYDLEKKRAEKEVKTRTDAIQIWNFLRDNANMNALRKRMGFGTNFEENMAMVMSTLGIKRVDELEQVLSASKSHYKKSEKLQTDSANIFTWSVIVKHISQQTTLERAYNVALLPELIQRLNSVFYSNIAVVENTRILLNEYGIKFITEEKRLDKVPVDGYSFWTGDNPTIVATLRMNRIDNFAFTIMHELGHIQLHLEKDGGKEFIDADHTIMHLNEEEKQANEYATRALWGGITPDDIYSQIDNPYAASKILSNIARTHRVNVGIVTGQYQFFCNKHGLVKNSYAICRDLIAKIGY